MQNVHLSYAKETKQEQVLVKMLTWSVGLATQVWSHSLSLSVRIALLNCTWTNRTASIEDEPLTHGDDRHKTHGG